MFPALANGFFTTEPPGKPLIAEFFSQRCFLAVVPFSAPRTHNSWCGSPALGLVTSRLLWPPIRWFWLKNIPVEGGEGKNCSALLVLHSLDRTCNRNRRRTPPSGSKSDFQNAGVGRGNVKSCRGFSAALLPKARGGGDSGVQQH